MIASHPISFDCGSGCSLRVSSIAIYDFGLRNSLENRLQIKFDGQKLLRVEELDPFDHFRVAKIVGKVWKS